MAETRDVGTLKLGLATAFSEVSKGVQAAKKELTGFRAFVAKIAESGGELLKKIDKAAGKLTFFEYLAKILGRLISLFSTAGSKIAAFGSALGKVNVAVWLVVSGLKWLVLEAKNALGMLKGFEKIKFSFGRMFVNITNPVLGFGRALNSVIGIFKKLASIALAPLKLIGSGFKSLASAVLHPFQTIKNIAHKTGEGIKAVFTGVKNFLARTFKWIAAGAAAAMTGIAVATKKLHNKVVEMSSTFEQFRITLGNLIKGDINAFMDMLTEKAKRTTMTLDDFVKASIGLVGVFGEGEEFKKVLDVLGDMTAGLKSIDVIPDEISRALRKLKMGQIGEAFERLGEWGAINWRELFGVEDLEDVSKLGVDKVWNTVFAELQKRYKGMAEESARSFSGIWTNIADTFKRFWKMIGEAGYFDLVKSGAKNLLDTLDRLEKNGTLQNWANKISGYLIGVYSLGQKVVKIFTELLGITGEVEGAQAGVGESEILKGYKKELEEVENQIKKIEDEQSKSKSVWERFGKEASDAYMEYVNLLTKADDLRAKIKEEEGEGIVKEEEITRLDQLKERLADVQAQLQRPMDIASLFKLEKTEQELQDLIKAEEEVAKKTEEAPADIPPIFKKISDGIDWVMTKIKQFVAWIQTEFSKIWNIYKTAPEGEKGSSVFNAIMQEIKDQLKDTTLDETIKKKLRNIGGDMGAEIINGLIDEIKFRGPKDLTPWGIFKWIFGGHGTINDTTGTAEGSIGVYGDSGNYHGG